MFVDVRTELLHVSVVTTALFGRREPVSDLEMVLHEVRVDGLHLVDSVLHEIILVVALVVRQRLSKIEVVFWSAGPTPQVVHQRLLLGFQRVVWVVLVSLEESPVDRVQLSRFVSYVEMRLL